MRAEEVADRFEMTDGRQPGFADVTAEVARRFPLGAFALLQNGDVFETAGGRAPPDGMARARAYLGSHVRFEAHGAQEPLLAQVRDEMCRLLEGNPLLVGRLEAAHGIQVDLVPRGVPLARLGYPPGVSPRAVGLFWNQPDWPCARMALRQEALGSERVLVIHEMAHAVHGLAFTREEREQLYGLMLRTYRSRAAVDEVFAIYSEREFLPDFDARERRTQGVYGMARTRWSEEHVLTRFVRYLYFPYKPLAGGRGR